MALAIFGTLCTAAGYTFQKLAHKRAAVSLEVAEAAEPRPPAPPTASSQAASAAAAAAAPPADDDEAAATAKSISGVAAPRTQPYPYWRMWQTAAGLACLVAGSGISTAALGLAGQAQLAPVACLTLAWQDLMSWRVLRESFGRADLAALVLMLGGTALALAFADRADPALTLADVLAKLAAPASVAYNGALAVVAAAAAVRLRVWARVPAAALSRGAYAADAFGRAAIGGLCGGWTGVLVKSLVSVLADSMASGSGANWATVWPWLLLAALAASLACQLSFLNSALARHEANRVVPIYQCTLVLANIAAGVATWGELLGGGSGAGALAAFFLGCATACAGVVVLTTCKPRAPQPAAGGAAGSAAAASADENAGARPVVPAAAVAIVRHPAPPPRPPAATGHHRHSASEGGAASGGNLWARRRLDSMRRLAGIVERAAASDDEAEPPSPAGFKPARVPRAQGRDPLLLQQSQTDALRRPSTAPASRAAPRGLAP